MRYRRAKTKGGTYFFTVVTHNRSPILSIPANISLLKNAFRCVMTRHPFAIDAIVVLPDHLHCIWTLPPGDEAFSTRWHLIKSDFSRQCDSSCNAPVSASRRSNKERSVWQRRFWEHQIRDEDDFKRHVEYIHHNPVKHGLVGSPKEWAYSSFHRYVRSGLYDKEWGAARDVTFDPSVGGE